MSVADWLNIYCEKTGGYKPGDFMPAHVRLEGEIIPEDEWPTTFFRPRDLLEIRAVPQGTDPFSITAALFVGVKAVFGMLMPKLPGTPNTPGQGDSLAQGSVRGNKVRLGEVVRESFGTQKIYPDYLVPPHKYYSGLRTQQTRFLMNLGVGSFQINALDVRIGETPLLALGAEAEYQIYPPGAYVGADESAEWWHAATEVGSSSTGAAGLELTASTSVTPAVSASSMVFNGYVISIPGGAGSFPSDWGVGMTIRVVAPYSYTVTDGGGTARDVITGPLSMLAPFVGQQIEVAGANAGQYVVNSWDGTNLTLDFVGGAPANSLVIGTGSAAIGPDGLRFKILTKTSSSITVERLDSAGSPDSSFPGFDALTTSSATISLDSGSLQGGWRGPFPACPLGELTSYIEWDVFFPQGIIKYNSNGSPELVTVGYQLQYRDIEVGGLWTTIGRTRTMASPDEMGFTERLALPYPMRPEVRMRKTSPLVDNVQVRAVVQWQGLKALLPSPASYAGCTVISGRVQISDRISAQSENQINVVATRILPLRESGVWLDPQPTREISPAAIYVAKSVGLTDDDIDLVELDRLADGVWQTRGDHFDMQVTEERTVKDVLNDIFGCGFAELTLDRGLIRPVRDEARTTLEQGYSAQNMIGYMKMDSELKSDNDFDGVEVTYQDARTWTEEVVTCRLPTDPNLGRRIEKITAPGITDRNKAYQFGMRRRRIHEYRRDSFSFNTPGDAMSSRYLSYCGVSCDVPGYSQSALLMGFETAGATTVLTSSEPLDWTAAGSYMAALRKPDGSLSGPYAATRIDDYRLSVPLLDFVPDIDWSGNVDPPHILFGPVLSWVYKVLITSVSPRGLAEASAEAVGYDERVYLSDDAIEP
jgi:hypothetical protein